MGADSKRRRVGLGTDSSCVRENRRKRVGHKRRLMGVDRWNQGRAGRTGREYSILARMEGDLRATIALVTRIWARTGATSGAGSNGACCKGGARGYGGGGGGYK
jgi:hypothetical protein